MKKSILFFAFTGLVLSINAQDTIASGNCGIYGNNLTWILTSDSTLTISGNGDMRDYASGFSGYNTQIKTVVIDSGVS